MDFVAPGGTGSRRPLLLDGEDLGGDLDVDALSGDVTDLSRLCLLLWCEAADLSAEAKDLSVVFSSAFSLAFSLAFSVALSAGLLDAAGFSDDDPAGGCPGGGAPDIPGAQSWELTHGQPLPKKHLRAPQTQGSLSEPSPRSKPRTLVGAHRASHRSV